MDSRSRGSRISNCRTVERYEGDLDTHFTRDRMQSLLGRLQYTKNDERARRPPQHRVPIDGNVYNGTATLRAAVNLYLKFKENDLTAVRQLPHEGMTAPPPQAFSRTARVRVVRAEWPNWEQPQDSDILKLARMVTQFFRYLAPEIVEAIAEDNRGRDNEWRPRLRALNIDPDVYLWEGSPCVWPGIRRYSGSAEIAAYRKKAAETVHPPDALRLDDNDFPKQVWAFALTNRKFAKHGPVGYALAHIVDHKPYNNRLAAEFEGVTDSTKVPVGLYTCPSNTVYTPTALIRPTDFGFSMRNLMVRRSHDLYGAGCNIVPPGVSVKTAESDAWELTNFQWADPVGETGSIAAFLDFRARTLDLLFAQAEQRQHG